MHRTSIELDEHRLAEVQRILGTRGIEATIEGAFDEVIRTDLRRRLARRLRSGDGIDRGTHMLEASRPPVGGIAPRGSL